MKGKKGGIIMLEKIKELLLKYKIVLLIVIILSILIIIFSNQKDNSDELIEYEESPSVVTKEEIPKTFKIDIKGEVLTPGVYEVNSEMIIEDAIKLAGGLTPQADTSNINLSQKLVSEMVIIIDSKESIKEPIKNNISGVGTSTTNSSSPNQKISLNKATLEELMTLSGIGESKAQKIIEYRTQTPFTSIEEITNVKGIGASIFEKNKDRLTI